MEETKYIPKDFDVFYRTVRDKVISLLKNKELQEGNICFEKIVGNTIKEMMIKDSDFKLKQITPRDEQNYPTKNVLFRTDSKTTINNKQLRIR